MEGDVVIGVEVGRNLGELIGDESYYSVLVKKLERLRKKGMGKLLNQITDKNKIEQASDSAN